VLILGSTGSIGTQALEVIGASDDLQVAGLSADSSWERVLAQAREHGVPAVAIADDESAGRAVSAWGGRVLAGENGIRELIAESKPDLVLNAVVGAAGLGPSIVDATCPTAPAAPETTTVSPALGLHISVIPKYAVSPGIPRIPI
jgi:1-deoxy-D-xylulose-5-phosphate reductoisomerase